MNGYGESYGAVSVINAIPCGIGATVGVKLRTKAHFTVFGGTKNVCITNDPAENTRMSEICVKRTFDHFSLPEPEGWSLEINSEIPVSRGLKSSSSACNAIISAVSDSLDIIMEPLDVVRLGVKCAREAGVTVTGAFDDACGCHLGGFVMTDNKTDSIIMRSNTNDADILLCVPTSKIRKSSLPKDRLAAISSDMIKITEIAKTDPMKAMTLNGRKIAEALGIDDELSATAMKMGAIAAGVSGTGPAISVVVKKGHGAEFVQMLEKITKYEIIHTETRRMI